MNEKNISSLNASLQGLGVNIIWFAACKTQDVPANGGVCVKYKDEQPAPSADGA